MQRSKDNYLELQNEAATRSNPEFQNHVKMLKEEPNPTDEPSPVAVQQSALNSFNSIMDDLKITTHTQAILRGFLMTYAECEGLIEKGYKPHVPVFSKTTDAHELTAIKDALS